MFWYIIGMGICVGIAWRMKRRGVRKNVYEAVFVMAIGFLLAAVLWQMDEGKKGQCQVARNPPGLGLEEKDYLVDAEGLLEQYPIKVPVEEKLFTKKQRQECFRQAKLELDQAILGGNESLERYRNLYICQKRCKKGRLR